MPNDIIPKLLKYPPIAIATIGIVYVISILEIDKYIPKIDLSIIREDSHTAISVYIMSSFIYVAIYLVVANFPWIKKIIRGIKINTIRKRNIITNIKELSEEELQLLFAYIYSENKCLPVNVNVPCVSHIINKEIAHIDGISEFGKIKAYVRISDAAWKYLNNNKARIFDITNAEIEEASKKALNAANELKRIHNEHPII